MVGTSCAREFLLVFCFALINYSHQSILSRKHDNLKAADILNEIRELYGNNVDASLQYKDLNDKLQNQISFSKFFNSFQHYNSENLNANDNLLNIQRPHYIFRSNDDSNVYIDWNELLRQRNKYKPGSDESSRTQPNKFDDDSKEEITVITKSTEKVDPAIKICSDVKCDDVNLDRFYTDFDLKSRKKYIKHFENEINSTKKALPNFVRGLGSKRVLEDIVYGKKKKMIPLKNKFHKQNKLKGEKELVSGMSIENEIDKIINSKAELVKIYPTSGKHIYIPKQLHRHMRQQIKKEQSTLYRKESKRQVKAKSTKVLPERLTFWRRNLNPAKKHYGVPFELEIQGLGQINV